MCYCVLRRQTGAQSGRKRKVQLIFRKRYSIYYMLAAAHGVQKQIVFVFAPWILIELMLRQADTTAILAVCTSFLGILFLPMVGRWMDRFGVKRLLYVETIGFVCIYLGYFFVSGGVASGRLAITGLPSSLPAASTYSTACARRSVWSGPSICVPSPRTRPR